MPLEGLLNMYVNDPALFWQVMYAITPGFIVGVLYGLFVYSQELNGRTTSSWQMWKFCLITNIISLLWVDYIADWTLTSMTVDVAAILIGLYSLMLMFPIVGGMMTGMRLMQAYWFFKRMVHQFRFYFRI